MKQRQVNIPRRLGAAVAALALVVSACGGDGSTGSGDGPGRGDAGGGEKTITIGSVEGWTDQTGTAYLLGNILESAGYEVKQVSFSDNAPLFAGMANGDIDIMGSAWPERTHKAYMDKYGAMLEELNTFYMYGESFMAVPDYSNVRSIADLPGHAAQFQGRVIGIEPGAGLTRLTKEKAFPDYGLGKEYQLVLSSTTAMLSELKKATDARQEIVVTLWKPFWANQAFPVRALEDPKGAYGSTEGLHTMAHKGFSEEYPEVADMIAHFELTDDQYGSLEDTIVNKFGPGQEAQAVAAWLKTNPDYANLLAGFFKK